MPAVLELFVSGVAIADTGDFCRQLGLSRGSNLKSPSVRSARINHSVQQQEI